MTQNQKPIPVYEVVAEEGGFAVHRNGRYLMSPAGAAYRVAQEPLAQAVAGEWRAQGDKIVPATMPMTQLLATALDIVGKDRAKIVNGLVAYADSELLCHRTEHEGELAQKQEALWQPFLNWCGGRWGVSFAVGCGVMPIRQHPDLAAKMRAALEAYDDFAMAGLSHATDVSGSLVLGLALAEGFAPSQKIFEAAELDATHQAAMWGEDAAAKARRDGVLRDLQACEQWFGLVRGVSSF